MKIRIQIIKTSVQTHNLRADSIHDAQMQLENADLKAASMVMDDLFETRLVTVIAEKEER